MGQSVTAAVVFQSPNLVRLEATMNLMRAGQLRLEPLMTHIVAFERAAQMYEIIAQNSLPHLSMTLDWSGAN